MKTSIIHHLHLLFFLFLFIIINPQQIYLNNALITFSLSGQLNYIPSTGGAAGPGYTFTLGFDHYSWIGIQFMTLTSSSNYDTLILQRSSTSSSGVYTATIQDYYISSGRPNVLMNDMITSLDKFITTTSNSSKYQLSFPRTLGNTNGQDWNGGQFVDICFFTSDLTFSQSTWSKQYSSCSGYQIQNYISTYRGSYISTFLFQNINSKLYGGFYGPFLKLKLFWYRPSSILTNTTNLYLRIGNKISQTVGYDYYKCGVGDYFGMDINTIQNDLDYSGYQNGYCNIRNSNTSIFLEYQRDVYTYDSFDYQMGSKINICIIGTYSSCSEIGVSYLVPVMSVKSALQIWEGYLVGVLGIMCLFGIGIL